MSDNERSRDMRPESAAVEAAREHLLLVLRLLAKEVALRLARKADPADDDRAPRLN